MIDGEAVWPTTNADIGLTLDAERAAASALAVGRTGTAADRARDVIDAAKGGGDLGWPRRAMDARLDRFVERVASDVDREAADGDVTVGASGVRMSPPAFGLRVDRALLRADLLGARDEIAIVNVGVEPIAPSIDEANVADVASRAETAFAPMRITAGTESLVVEASRIGELLRIRRDGAPGAERLVLAVDGPSLETLVREIAETFDGDARDAALIPGDEYLTVVPGRDAVRVDRAAAAAALAASILAGSHALAIPAVVSAPSFSTAAAVRTATETRLAAGFTTYFPENEARRINISRAATTFDGLVIAPGETFSFWQRIGEVSTRTGYAYAGAIIGGISSTAIGGGLCQVSTTLFNAVAAAGYAIDERHPHAYYIERYPIGLDAAVFAPDTDLAWTNDTAMPAIIRAAATDTSVSFWIYSPPTGRVTTFTDPVEWDLRWPYPGQPADPAHVPGYVVLGRDVLVTRTVSEGAAVIHRDDFISHYAPVWGGPG